MVHNSGKRAHDGRGVDTRVAALTALRAGVDALLKNTLPSAWSPHGRGWQELWPDATRAGFYASCDGLIALAKARAFVEFDLEIIADQLLGHHLTPFLTPTVVAPDAHAEQQRALVLTTTMKLAKYLQAYAAVGCPAAQSRDAKRIATMLLKDGGRVGGRWSYVLGGTDASIIAITEAVLGLRAAGFADADVIADAVAFLATIDWRKKLREVWTVRDLAIWAACVCRLDLVPHHISRADINRCLQTLLVSQEVFEHAHWYERFVNRRAGANDYYTQNVTLVLAEAIVRLIASGVLDEMYIRLVDPVIVQVVSAMQTTGVFAPTGTTYFWENAEAHFLITAYLTTVEALGMPITPGMFVSPRYFGTTRFMYDKKMAAILMPFGPDWANDVYAAFSEVTKVAKFKPWRADQEHADDVIIQTIWKRINESRFVIADCTGRNPNVFYELGIAHTIGKPVFICAPERADIPFDVQGIRSTTYRETPSGIATLKNELQQFIAQEVRRA